MRVVSYGRRSHLAPKVPQAKQNVCVHNLSFSTLIFHPFSLLSTFVDIMIAVKKIDFDLDVGSRLSVIKAMVEDIEIKKTM